MQIAEKAPVRGTQFIFLTAAFCLLISGAAGLVYQVAWTRYLALFTGHTSYAVLAVLTAFMGGLAIGNAWFGKLADASSRPLALYGWLEVGIGIYGLCFPAIYFVAHGGYLSFTESLVPGSPLVLVCKFVFAILTLIIPTVLMGGTLPVLTRLVTRSLSELRERVSALYAINSAGAVIGVGVGEFYLIAVYGLEFAVTTGAILNLMAGALALTLNRYIGETVHQSIEAVPDSNEGPAEFDYQLAAIGIGISGFVAMLYEVAWTRVLALTMGSGTHAFAIMLMTFITGIALGAWIIGRLRRLPSNLDSFAWLEIAVGCSILLSMTLYERLPLWFVGLAETLNRTPENYGTYQLLQFVVCFCVMIIPTTILGMTLPLVGRISTGELSQTGRRIGMVFSLNTIGTVVGVLFTGLWLMPNLGLARTFALGASLNIMLGVVILYRNSPDKLNRALIAAPLGACVIVLAAGSLFHQAWMNSFNWGLWNWETPPGTLAELRQYSESARPLFYSDGAEASVMVRHFPDQQPVEMQLLVNGKIAASTFDDMPTQLLLGYIPAILHAGPRNVLVVGLGSGITCGAVMRHPTVESVDAVEISRDVIQAARLFENFNDKALENPKLHVFAEDAKSFLLNSGDQYDIIINAPSNPWMAGVAGVLSREFYLDCHARLAEGGIVAQWFHVNNTSDEVVDTIIATFTSVFPSATLWQSSEHDLIMLGAKSTLHLDFKLMDERINSPTVRSSLKRIDIEQHLTLLAHQLTSSKNTIAIPADSTPLNYDDRPVLEGMAQRGFFARGKAENWKIFDERNNAQGSLLLHSYLQKFQVVKEVFANLSAYHLRYNLLSENQFRSLLLRWQNRHPESIDPVIIGASLETPRLTAEVEVVKIRARMRELLEASGSSRNPGPVRTAVQTLLKNYRAYRSVFYYSDQNFFGNLLKDMINLDPTYQRVYRLYMAEMLYDSQDMDAFVRMTRDAFNPDTEKYGPLLFDIDRDVPRFITARLIQYQLRTSQLNEASSSCQFAIIGGLYSKDNPMEYPLLGQAVQRTGVAIAVQSLEGTSSELIPPSTNAATTSVTNNAADSTSTNRSATTPDSAKPAVTNR